MKKRKIELVLFDLDGTLLESMFEWGMAMRDYFQAVGVKNVEQAVTETAQMTPVETALYLQDRFGIKDSIPKIIVDMDRFMKIRYAKVQPKAYALETLRDLKALGYKVMITTATSSDLFLHRLKPLGILELIDGILSAEDMGCTKRTPEIWMQALELQGVVLDNALVVEDTLEPILTAQKAGFPVWAVEEAYHQKDAEEISKVADVYLTTLEGFAEKLQNW